MIDSIQLYASAVNGRRYEFAVDVPDGIGRTALLFVHTMVASTTPREYAISLPAGWHEVGGATRATTNRQYVAGVWSMPEPSAGRQLLVVETSRVVVGIVAFWCLSDIPPLRAVASVVGAEGIEAAGPFSGPVLFAVQARYGATEIATDTGEVLNFLAAAPESTGPEVAAALLLAEPGEVVRAQAVRGRLALLLGVELADEDEIPTEPPPPLKLKNEISVIVRDIPMGGSHEVRHVRPGDLVVRNGDIMWEETPFTSYILVNDDEAESSSD